MNGPTPEAVAKIKSNPKSNRIVTIGISHHIFRCHKNLNNSLTTPKFDVMLRMKLFMVTFLSIRKYSCSNSNQPEYHWKHSRPKCYFRTTKSFTYSVSISLLPNVCSAFAGVVTIGSPRKLKLVFNNTGTPVAWPNSSIAR